MYSKASALLMFALALFGPSRIVMADTQDSPMVLAAYQAWHGLPSHSCAWDGRHPYISTDHDVIERHIRTAIKQDITGFLVDWYGPEIEGGAANNEDRKFIDQATAELIRQAEEVQDFYVAIMYDEGTVWAVEGDNTSAYQDRVKSDLDDIEQYLASPAYLKIDGEPALFVFPKDGVDQKIDWSSVRTSLDTAVTLIDHSPNPDTPEHDAQFDGFYAWVQPTHDCNNWGEDYLNWFYRIMNDPSYASKIAVGGVWSGFDDLLADWGENRCISRRNGRTRDDTWALADENNPPYVLIETWNDFEEGTDIEFGVDMIVDMDDPEDPNPELLPRSSPIRIIWTSGGAAVQAYKYGDLIYNEDHNAPGVSLTLESDAIYEVKIWRNASPTSKWIKIRRQQCADRSGTTACDVELTVTPSAGSDGSIIPSTEHTVYFGENTAITVTPEEGYYRNNAVDGTCPQSGWSKRTCGQSDWGKRTWISGAINANCTLSFSFAPLPRFGDAPKPHWAWAEIEAIAEAGITLGCGPDLYCPENLVSRAEMAAFLLRAMYGGGYRPPEPTGDRFNDVPASHWAAAWIEKLAAEGITQGCGGGKYCPENPVTRAEMAVFLLRSKHGSGYRPPPATGTRFKDVPRSHWAADWIEQLAAEGITGGCGNGNYCPDSSVTRAQMAVFLARTFNLPLPPPP